MSPDNKHAAAAPRMTSWLIRRSPAMILATCVLAAVQLLVSWTNIRNIPQEISADPQSNNNTDIVNEQLSMSANRSDGLVEPNNRTDLMKSSKEQNNHVDAPLVKKQLAVVEKGSDAPTNTDLTKSSFHWNETEATLSEHASRILELAHQSIPQRYIGPFDVLYLWANSTREWFEQKQAAMRRTAEYNSTKVYGSWSPTRDNNELLLSILSVERYWPWVRNIYLLTNDGEIPGWMDETHPRIRIVDSNQLLQSLNGGVPNFNSHALYLASAWIEDISEIYIQLDDDFIVGHPMPPHALFSNYEHEISSVVSWAKRGDLKTQSQVLRKMLPAYELKWASHMPRCWNKTRVQALWNWYPKEIQQTIQSPLRLPTDIDLTSFYAPYIHAHYNVPVFEYHDQDIWAHNYSDPGFSNAEETAVPLHLNHYSRGGLLHAYVMPSGIGGLVKQWKRSPSKRPAFVCVQDKGDEDQYQKILDMKSAFFVGDDALAVPYHSSFEKVRHLPPINETKIYGHRGLGVPNAIGEAPIMENTMESFQAAYDHGIRWIELDVGITKDGVVIVGHFHKQLYEDCKRGGRDKPIVSDSTLAALLSVAGRDHRPEPITLAQVLGHFGDKFSGFQIELKQDTDYKLAGICNQAAAAENILLNNGTSSSGGNAMMLEQKCLERSMEHDLLVEGVASVLEKSKVPPHKIIVSSFEAPRLHNFLQLLTHYNNVKLVGAQLVGVEGMIRIAQQWLGPHPHLAIPLGFATSERTFQLRQAGITVEIGLPGPARGQQSSCLSEQYLPENDEDVFLSNMKQQGGKIQAALAMQPDSICTDFPRLAQQIMKARAT